MNGEQKHTTIRVTTLTRDKIAHIAEQEGRPMTAVIDDAVADYETKMFWQTLREQIERTQREDPESWAEYVAETELFDNAAADGLGTDDIPSYTIAENPHESPAGRDLAD
ncbi:hypothetical protein Psi02_26490 [Planotetraspora silvatica]|uniref:Uncharacterized protein n=1 Tax=Planotetraspora silvatica TaxID=234614 RepID=A0A8J3UKM4_9ACTN|nr:hypothetical protein [Planotetraspora silvatica]GII46225.1 hypothetical protein Psi02_26490 [Planotetraspora silvatica]